MFTLFCDVIDNYGDAGVCLRLCRDLCVKNYQVTFFCNNLETLSKILTKEDRESPLLKILPWPKETEEYSLNKVIIQAFSVRLPSFILEKIKKEHCEVINLEYLTAETFAEDCHTLPSFADGMQSYFFFPGFTKKTGGVVIEDNFLSKIRNKTQSSDYMTLFSYENNKVMTFLNNLKKVGSLNKVLVFEGKPLDNLNKLLGTNLKVGDTYQFDNLTIVVKEMVGQDEYDTILANAKINLVRGEDSIVRAMITGVPFLWHIYPQDEDAHKFKILALFERMKEYCQNKDAVEKLQKLTLSYNGFSDYINDFDIAEFMEDWQEISKQWSENLISLGSLTNNLLDFINQKITL